MARHDLMRTSSLVITQTTDLLSFVGSFFAPPGEKRTYRRRKVPCCRTS
jgi:hypothetical protein